MIGLVLGEGAHEDVAVVSHDRSRNTSPDTYGKHERSGDSGLALVGPKSLTSALVTFFVFKQFNIDLLHKVQI